MATIVPGQKLSYLERAFQIQERGSTWRTEMLAGLTTFLTMAVHRLRQPRHPEPDRDAGARCGCRHLSLRRHRLHPDGVHRQLPHCASARHGAERLLRVHRGEGNGRTLADCSGLRVYLRLRLSDTDRGGHSPVDRERHPSGAVLRGCRGGGFVCRVCWVTRCGHHRAQCCYDRRHGQYSLAADRPRLRRAAVHRRFAGLAHPHSDAHWHCRHDHRRLRPGHRQVASRFTIAWRT